MYDGSQSLRTIELSVKNKYCPEKISSFGQHGHVLVCDIKNT